VLDNKIVDKLAKKAAENEYNELPNMGYTSFTHIKVMARRSCLHKWSKYAMDLEQKRKFGTFYTQHFGSGAPHWKAHKTVVAKRIHSALIQLKLGHGYFGSYLAKRTGQSDRCFNGCRAKQTPEHLLLSCSNYRQERKPMMKLAKKFIEGPGPVRFVHLFANALITDEVIKFIQATGISTRNWL
jgi:hypothetical protein